MSENKINSSFGEITLQVSPAQLNSMASDISKKADTVNSSFSDIYSKVDGMLIYWRGVVADEKVSALKKQKESTDNMIKNLKTYVEKLRQITENYETAENTSVAEAGELPSNILALKRADELSETARNIMKVSENISNDVMAGLEADWHGNSATDYKRKLNLFSAKVECEAKKLENIANTIRRVAKRTYDTEMQSLEISRKRTYK